MAELSGNALDAKLRELLAEDVGGSDVTTEATVPANAVAKGRFLAKSSCVVSGLAPARRVLELLDPRVSFKSEVRAGDRVESGAALAAVSGSARALLTGERLALNLLQRMCGIATETRRF